MGYATLGFEALEKKYRNYIWTVANRCKGRDRLNDRDDIISELNLVLYRVAEAYPDVDETEFVKKLKASVSNRMATLMTGENIERKLNLCSLSQDGRSSSRGQSQQPNTRLSDRVPQHVMTDKNYRDDINDILKNVSPTSAMVIMELLDPTNRGKFMTGSKEAYNEVKQYLEGNRNGKREYNS